jgi:hypothetical protein
LVLARRRQSSIISAAAAAVIDQSPIMATVMMRGRPASGNDVTVFVFQLSPPPPEMKIVSTENAASPRDDR